MKPRCPFCSGWTEEDELKKGEYNCRKCGSVARFLDEELIAMSIPSFDMKVESLKARVEEISRIIDCEGRRGQERDLAGIRDLHNERKSLLSELRHICCFSALVSKW